MKWYSKAVLAELHHKNDKAIFYFKKSIRKNPHNVSAYRSLANLYMNRQNFDSAAMFYKLAVKASPGYKGELMLPLAEALFRAKKYNDASGILNQITETPKTSQTTKNKIKQLHQSLRWAPYALQRVEHDTPINLGMRINSQYNEYFPSINLDDSVMVFTRETNGIDQDFYLAKRDSCGGWFDADPLTEPPNSSRPEAAQMLSADGHYLFFTRCQNRSPNGWSRGGCDLYFSYTDSTGWSQPIPFGATINTPAFEGMPALSPDNKTLYFVSNRKGGYGGMDIWMSKFENGLWQVPKNLGPTINTAGDETSPWIAADNQTLYFTSDGHPGFGGKDIYVSRKQSDSTWGKPIDLGYPINTPSDDASITVTNGGVKAYFASNRLGSLGGMDIYTVNLPENLRPQPRTFVYGIVHDSLTGQRLRLAVMTWTNARTGKIIAQYTSNRGDASYFSAFPVDTELALSVIHYQYLHFRDTLQFSKRHIFPPDTLNIALLPDDYQPPLTDTILFVVHFKTNGYTINDSIANAIKKIVRPLNKGRYSDFFVNGFTDTSGYQEINKSISVQRAVALKNILLAAGVSPDKITVHGWSDSSPVASNATEEGRAKNRRAVLIFRRPK